MEAGVSREEVLEREQRRMRPVGLIALASLLLVLAAIVVRQAAVSGSQLSEQLHSAHQHPAAVVASGLLLGVGVAALCVPLLFLYTATRGRNPRIAGFILPLCVLGPVLFGISTTVTLASTPSVASDFLAVQGKEPSKSYAQFKSQLSANADSIDTVGLYTDSHSLEVKEADSVSCPEFGLPSGVACFYGVKSYPPDQEDDLKSELDDKNISVVTDSGGTIGDALANDINVNNSVQRTGALIGLLGLLALLISVVYTVLNAQRVGLITRMMGGVGIGLAVVSVIPLPLPVPGPILLVFWFGFLGMLLLGRLPRGRPPAWEAGVAVPWPRPGEPPGEAPIEGTAREVDPNAPASNPPRQRGERRKRKSRG